MIDRFLIMVFIFIVVANQVEISVKFAVKISSVETFRAHLRLWNSFESYNDD